MPRSRSSPTSNVSTQEIRGSINASDSTTTTPPVQEVPRNGMMAPIIRAINDDDAPVPVWHVADHEKGSEGPQPLAQEARGSTITRKWRDPSCTMARQALTFTRLSSMTV